MKRFLQKIAKLVCGILILAGLILPSVSAQQTVSLPTFKITMNNVKIDNNERLYPIIVYRDITYVPMTYNDSRFLGLETKWSADSGLQVGKTSVQTAYKPDRGYSSAVLENAVLPDFRIRVNGQDIDNKNETYPLLVFRDITYFPLTWRYMVDEFGWTSSFDASNGLVINSRASQSGASTSTPVGTESKVFSQDFGGVTVIFDRYAVNQPGNLYVKENNIIRKVGNPNYIYGVGYLQAGTYGEYTAVDKVEYANRSVYTLAVDPSITPIISKNVKINIDTNEVQALDGGTVSAPVSISDQVYSKQFGTVTVLLDRASNKQSGNLYVRENNVLRRVGNPNYIYGVSYFKLGPFETYNAIDSLDLSDRWVTTLAINPAISPLVSKNARVNIDTNEVQFI